MDELIDPKDSAVCVQQIRYGKYVATYVCILLVKRTLVLAKPYVATYISLCAIYIKGEKFGSSCSKRVRNFHEIVS